MNCTFTIFLCHLIEFPPLLSPQTPWNLLLIHGNLPLGNVRPRRTLEVIHGKATPSMDFSDPQTGYVLWLRAWDTDRCGSCALVSFLINHPSMLPYLSSQCICSFPTVLANAGRTNASRVGSSKLLFFTPKVPSPPLPPTLPEKGCFSNSSHERRQSQSPVASGAEKERFGWTGFSVLCCC